MFQVDLKRRRAIRGIITQGGLYYSSQYSVKSFKVSHSDDGQSWTVIRDARGSEVRAADKLVIVLVYYCGLLLNLE